MNHGACQLLAKVDKSRLYGNHIRFPRGIVGILMKWSRGVPYIYNVPISMMPPADSVHA
jgi:hypothetical protein